MDNMFFSYFNQQVLTNPDGIAVSFRNKNLSYKDLQLISDNVAVNLVLQYQVKRDDVIGVCMEKSDLTVAIIVGILRSGASFVLIDTKQPLDRKKYIIQNSNCRLVVMEENDLEVGVPIDYADNFLVKPTETITVAYPRAKDTAYIVYTSGTTGLPKGSMIAYEGLTNMAKSQSDILGFRRTDALLQFASFSFDAAIAEIFETLISGATLVIPTSDETKDINALYRLLRAKSVTILTVTPSFLASIKPLYLSPLRILLIVGEQLYSSTIEPYINTTELYNSYGVSECSICSTIYKIPKDYKSKIESGQPIPIGQPIPKVIIEILNEKMERVVAGEVGEMYIGGVGVSKGYLDRKKLDEERFLNLPELEGIFFRTGDKAKMLESGDIVFFGRIDDQIKIRGIRIEPGEIETILNAHPLVSNSFVTLQTNGNEKKLIAYLEPSIDTKDNRAIRDFLKEKLPAYMIPNHIISVEKFPLTINGKLDKRALPKIENESIVDTFLDEENIYDSLKKTLLNVLKISSIMEDGNFFEEYGCDSLHVVRICVIFEEQTSIRIKYEWLYEYPTLQSLYNFIKRHYENSAVGKRFPSISKIDVSWVRKIKSKVSELGVKDKDFDGKGDYFLTGATGFVGCHILNEILTDSRKKVYCLVRKKERISTRQRVLNSLRKFNIYNKKFENRIITIEGDLDDENFGITLQKYEEISREVSDVFHIAVNMNHIAPYETLEKTNVKGIRRIVNFCTNTRLKKLHYSSSSSIFTGNKKYDKEIKKIDEEFPLEMFEQPEHNGYSRSKFDAELNLQHLMQVGFPCNIYRFDLIIPDSINAIKSNQWIDILIEVCLETKVIFNDFSEVKFAIDSVSKVAEAMVKLAKRSTTGSIYHVFSNDRITLNEFLDKAINIDKNFKIVTFESWCEYVCNYFSNTDSRINFMLQTLKDINSSSNISILKSEKTLSVLQKENFSLHE